jgi:uncharacterized protein
MTISPQNDPIVVEAASAILSEMKNVSVSLVYAALLTDDGFDVARLPSRVTDGPRFASMASSMQALSDAVAHELRIGTSEYLIISSGRGYVIQLRVPGSLVVLSALFDNDATVGAALALTRNYAAKMTTILAGY